MTHKILFVDDEKDIDSVVYLTKTIPADDFDCPMRETQAYHIVQIPFKTSDVFFSENIITK